MRVFVDTNLWVYRLDQREPEKSLRVSAWLREVAENDEIVVSTQVLIELRSVLTRKLKPPMAYDDVQIALAAVSSFEVVSTDTHLVLDAHLLAQQEQFGWFDALIVEAAIRSGCSILFSEDLGDGRVFSGLTVRNPLHAQG